MAEGLQWFRADSNLPTNDKILELASLGARGKAAGFVYIMSLAHAVGNGTEGLIRRGALPFVHGTPADARLLVEHRLWTPVDHGWQIVNFGTRQAVGAAAESLSEKRAEAGRRGAAARWGGQG